MTTAVLDKNELLNLYNSDLDELLDKAYEYVH